MRGTKKMPLNPLRRAPIRCLSRHNTYTLKEDLQATLSAVCIVILLVGIGVFRGAFFGKAWRKIHRRVHPSTPSPIHIPPARCNTRLAVAYRSSPNMIYGATY